MGLTFNLGRVSPSVFTDSSLNIGIGAAPSGTYKLEVTGTAKVSSTLLLGGALTGTSATFSDILAESKTADGIIQTIGGNITKANIYQFTSGGVAGAVFNIGHNFYYDGTNYGQGNAAKSGWVISSNLNADSFAIARAAAGSTSAPTSILSFASTGAATFSSSITAGGRYFATTSVNDNILEVINTDTTNGYGLFVRGGGTATNRYVARFKNAADSDVMWIGNTGNVGIGTTTPTNGKLEIQTGVTTAGLWVQTGGTNSTFVIADFRTGTNLSALNILGNGNSIFGGNVGIGGTPSRLLEVISGSETYLRITGNRGNADGVTISSVEFYNAYTSIVAAEIRAITGVGGTQSNSGQLAIFTTNAGTNSEKIRISKEGELYLRNPTFGSFTNTIKLGTYVDYSGGSYIQAGSNPTLTGSTSLDLGTADGSGILIVNNASRTIRMASLAGSGSRTVTADASGNLSASSDSSLKQEDKEYKIQGLAEILQLQPRAYKWLSDIEIRGEEAATEIGFFADEVNPIIPSAAPKGNDDLFGFYDRAVIAAMVKAIQELQEQINELKNK